MFREVLQRSVHVAGARHRWTLRAEALPAYAPDLNPNEYAWGHDKGGVLANACPADVAEIAARAGMAVGQTGAISPAPQLRPRHEAADQVGLREGIGYAKISN